MSARGVASDERGQVLVQVALTLIVLLISVGLAIDIGNAYGERRQMQNAADAAALAGARELCLGNSATVANAKAREYLLLNEVLAGHIQVGDIQVIGNVVDVTARVTTDTFLVGLIGINTIDVTADAEAACGAATAACGLWPIAFSQSAWQEDVYAAGVGCGRKFAVWADNNSAQALECDLDQDGVAGDDICDCYICEDDDGAPFTIVDTEGRAWLDFSEAVEPYTDSCTSPGCGASELACQLRNGAGARVEVPTCISGDNGVKAGVKDDVQSRAGDTVHIPLYSSLSCGTANCPGGNTYEVTEFGCIEVIGWEHNFELTPQDPALYNKAKGKLVWAKVSCSGQCMTACGSTDGTPPEPWELKAVGLVE